MMKTFYTERDIEDMHATGQIEIEVNDDVVLTDLAREKAIALGMRLIPVEKRSNQAERMLRALGAHLPSSAKDATRPPPPKTEASQADPELVERVKAGVIAKLGTTEYNGLLDQVIPQVLARLTNNPKTTADHPSPATMAKEY